jgi:DNA-binding LacI/PurR family transcriptional regulator
MVTIKDISRKCGVSPATVSKALNGYGDISKETMALVRETAQKMHYLPNAAARQLKTNISHNIGVLFVDDTMCGLTHEFFAAILNSVRDEAERLGYDITFIGQNIGGEHLSFTEHCLYRNCDGVIIASVDFESEQVSELIKSGVPVVTIDYSFNNVSCVLSDNMEGAYELVSYLADRGHKRIAFIHGENTSVTQKRLLGFYRAMEEFGLDIREEYIVDGKFHEPKSSREATRYLMELPEPPTAILYPDDYSYLGGMTELERMNLSVPDDVSVVGYDGIGLSQFLRPKLTTYRQDTDGMGRRAARKLVEKIENQKTCVTEQIKVSGKLLEGYSVADIT